MKNIHFKTKETQKESNGKAITLIGEFCQSWGINRKIENFILLLINPILEKGFTVKYGAIPVPFKIPSDYKIFKVVDNIKVFSNQEEDKKRNYCWLWNQWR